MITIRLWTEVVDVVELRKVCNLQVKYWEYRRRSGYKISVVLIVRYIKKKRGACDDEDGLSLVSVHCTIPLLNKCQLFGATTGSSSLAKDKEKRAR